MTFAFGAYETEIDLLPIGCGAVERIPGSTDERLDALGPDILLVDFAFPGTRTPCLPGGLQYVGQEEFELKSRFNGLLWMRHSPKMHPLRWSLCQ